MIKFDPKHYSINDFWEWDRRRELILTPVFQRRSVWSAKARSFLIDTIIRGLPIPKIFMRHDIDPRTRKSKREIVDGQQRLSAILNYLEDGFKISRVHNKDFAGKYFSQLPLNIQKDMLEYYISVDILLGAEDAQVLDIFARLNTYMVRLNNQELINSRYFGVFKSTVYSLGYEYLNFWTSNNILTDKEIARMGDAEFTSELVIFLLDGIQDRKKIESFYKQYDDEFPMKRRIVKDFREIIEILSEIFKDNLASSSFASKPLFYTLFGAIAELNREKKLKKADYPKIYTASLVVDNIMNSKPEELSSSEYNFYDAATKHVTDLSVRKTRHGFVKKLFLNKMR